VFLEVWFSSGSDPDNYVDVGLSQIRALFQTSANTTKILNLCILRQLLFFENHIAPVYFIFLTFLLVVLIIV
jgi:hypothetical protein